MVDQVDEGLLRKIRALQAKANGTNNEHEAATFAAKVQELLEKHNLSAEVLRVTKEAPHGGVGRHDAGVKKAWSRSPWRRSLVSAVAAAYMCKALRQQRFGDETWILIGKPSNVAVATGMIEYLIETADRLSRAHVGDKVEFKRGLFNRLSIRMIQLRDDKLREERMREGNNPGNLPALFTNEQALIDGAIDAMFGKINVSKFRGKARGSVSFYEGDSEGRKVNLNQQIGGR